MLNRYLTYSGRKSERCRFNCGGFSLIELMVVVSIFVIIAAITTPPLLRWRTNAKLRGAASNLTGDLELAKMRAIRENSYVAVLFSSDGYTIFVDNGADAGDWIEDEDEACLREKTLPAGVRLKMPTGFSNDRTRFAGRGIPENTGTVTLISLSGQEKEISVNRLGKITLE
jgi:prepilin-type N-terminal cleavage/methylation domain-containing protein